MFLFAAAERDVCNDLQRAVARMLRELLGAVAAWLDRCRVTGEYGGLGTSLLFGSEELSAAYPRGVGCYYQDVLVTADFSVMAFVLGGLMLCDSRTPLLRCRGSTCCPPYCTWPRWLGGAQRGYLCC